jgi:hypothetical protein
MPRPPDSTDRYRALKASIDEVHRKLLAHVASDGDIAVVKAPPGSGKTYLLLKAVAHARALGKRVAVATQTNAQAHDVCVRLASHEPSVPCFRFAGASTAPENLGPAVQWAVKPAELPLGPCVAVGTSAKWGAVEIIHPFDVLFIDEAWQLSWANFMPMQQVSGRFVMIGDPGQIPPIVPIDPARWETAPTPPHRASPEVVLARSGNELPLNLPATWRLPYETTTFVRDFYDFEFDAVAAPGARGLIMNSVGSGAVLDALQMMGSATIAGLTIQTPVQGPPVERDDEIASLAVEAACRLLEAKTTVVMDGETSLLQPEDIGLAATHRVMNSAMQLRIPSAFRDKLWVDTPERWQGLQRKVMIVVHPLSGVTRPSSFDLETGRLCVMASRHQVGLLVVSRDHVGQTLDDHIPSAEQAPGLPDVTGRGHDQHLRFWKRLQEQGQLVRAA